ncbi:Uncharacterised protein [Vibrio cholerae]|nr:Uncharacterised protein [Vibrio cholerae]
MTQQGVNANGHWNPSRAAQTSPRYFFDHRTLLAHDGTINTNLAELINEHSPFFMRRFRG